MTTMDATDLTAGMTTQQALDLFDSLEPVDLEFMLGRWTGAEIPTDHPMDGLLVAVGWYGKWFESEDEVHPLLVSANNGSTYSMTPYPFLMRLSLNFPVFRQPFMRPANKLTTRLVQTKSGEARIRMVEYRGKTSATMIYDRLPIHDHFRRLDDDTLMGLMDFKWTEEPYFFMLMRE